MTSANQSTAILITIPLSHYCEKARWALDRTGLIYREEPHAPLLHRLATRRNDGGTVPILVHNANRLIDSTDILQYADKLRGGDLLYLHDVELRKEVELLEERFDTELGPHTRRWAYAHLLSQAALIRDIWSRGVPRLEANVISIITPAVRYLVRATYRINPDSAARSLARVRAVFHDMDVRLSDGRRFLVGEQFTAADLTFAALAAPMLAPAENRAVYPSMDQLPIDMQQEIQRMRGTVSGQFALRMFADERNRPSAG